MTQSGRDVWQLYHRFAGRFDEVRGRQLMERDWLDLMLSDLPTQPGVLDLGCGMGEPIARYLLDQSCRVTGVDAASAMIGICRARFPASRWLVGDMRGLDLGERFDALVAWDSFFHLDADDQRVMFPVFARHLEPGGRLMFTSGSAAGIAIGDLFGEPLFHASLASAEYRELLAANGFEVVRHRVEDPGCGGHTVWLARRLPIAV
ncbi:MAG: class I SAM-dependent methyltransferase [Hyphomicrobiaceae bacterium]